MKAWRMAFRTGTGGDELWPDCRRNRVASIEYPSLDDVDLSQYPQGEPATAWALLAPTQKASIRRFAYEINVGDVIYVKQGPVIAGKGVVSGPYRFEPNTVIREPNGVLWQHQRLVNWDREFAPVHLLVGRSQQLTVEELCTADVSMIERARGPLPLTSDDVHDLPEDVPYIGQLADCRARLWQQICLRRGQAKFRDALLQRYGGICVVTGCVLSCVLEAAHIDPYRCEAHNHPENGLLLRADVHTLFDLDMLGVNPATYRIALHPNALSAYPDLDGAPLRCVPASRPSRHALERRFASFRERLNASF